MKKVMFTLASLAALFGCAPKGEDLVNPDGFVLEHPAIDVADPVATAKWWCDNLGFTMTRQKDDETHTTFIVDASGRVAIEMYRAKTQPTAPDYVIMSNKPYVLGNCFPLSHRWTLSRSMLWKQSINLG